MRERDGKVGAKSNGQLGSVDRAVRQNTDGRGEEGGAWGGGVHQHERGLNGCCQAHGRAHLAARHGQVARPAAACEPAPAPPAACGTLPGHPAAPSLTLRTASMTQSSALHHSHAPLSTCAAQRPARLCERGQRDYVTARQKRQRGVGVENPSHRPWPSSARRPACFPIPSSRVQAAPPRSARPRPTARPRMWRTAGERRERSFRCRDRAKRPCQAFPGMSQQRLTARGARRDAA